MNAFLSTLLLVLAGAVGGLLTFKIREANGVSKWDWVAAWAVAGPYLALYFAFYRIKKALRF